MNDVASTLVHVRAAPAESRRITQCVQALTSKLPVEEIWLFGSCARGTATDQSDVDLLTVLPDDHGVDRPALAAVRAISRERAGLDADVVVITRAAWENHKQCPFGLYQGIIEEGRCIFERRR